MGQGTCEAKPPSAPHWRRWGESCVRFRYLRFQSALERHSVKATGQCFPAVLFIMLYEVVVTFESLDGILRGDHSIESY